ncbi:MAG: choice-of-anchor D domain-containing protein [Acidobacteriota bacterium]|nr:choice-of-anchor D domain-containing protein [Acidobacteriota bacterium]
MAALRVRAGALQGQPLPCVITVNVYALCIFIGIVAAFAQAQGVPPIKRTGPVPPRVVQAQRFLAQRGWSVRSPNPSGEFRPSALLRPVPSDASAGLAAWQPLGPESVTTASFGAVTGRISSIAFDPADSTGNHVYVGTTGGGVWVSQNAATSNQSNVAFTPLTDTVDVGSFASNASISIGAVSVQPGGTGVVLAGTGDPNDALDSYYGGGILRSTDNGSTWSVIGATSDYRWSFAGEGFAGFAWSTTNPQLVVAAVSQSYEGMLVDAERASSSYRGLYYSIDSGATWSLARITDGATDVQGPNAAFALPHGNAVTSVVWNQVRKLFYAAVRYHGYYQSVDGQTWTRMVTQPGTNLTAALCPSNPGTTGSVACPIFRGTLAVNLITGDTFAWTVDVKNQDQGIWQDPCAISSGACGNTTAAFAQRWSTADLESNTVEGAATIVNGDYTLALAAVPSGQDTILMAGDGDLWKCSLALGCVWRNSTNAFSCRSAHVAPYQHAFAWNAANPLEVFVGNDSGVWRSFDAISESGAACDASDATHFQNLNQSLGSLTEAAFVAQSPVTPYTLMAGLGANGTAGVKATSGAVADWPQILDGEGGPNAIDATDDTHWFANNQAGVAIHLCAQSSDCTPTDFGSTPIVTEADVSNDGVTMTVPANFLIDPLDNTRLLVATCRVWRGPIDGSAWSNANAISGFLDGVSGKLSCNGDALIRVLAAMPIAGGDEVLYAGMYGQNDGGATRAGHVFRAVYTPGDGVPAWSDLTFNPVSNESAGFNVQALDITSIAIDSGDTTGNTLYVTVGGVGNPTQPITTAYQSTDGGAHWQSIASNLPTTPANAVVVDPQDSATIYIATDVGVYSTRQISSCTSGIANCWSKFGTGLPMAPVVSLSTSAPGSSESVLVAGTYGRGVWKTGLWTAGTQQTTATATPSSLSFASQTVGTTSAAQTVTITNAGSSPLEVSAVSITGDFAQSGTCAGATINPAGTCTLHVTFTPTQTGTRTGSLSLAANISGGQLSIALSGDGTASSATFVLSPASLDFGQIQVGSTSPPFSISVSNTGISAVTVSSLTATTPFAISSSACGASIAANSSCQVTVTFSPTQQGSVSGTLTMVDSVGTQTVSLIGNGASAPTDSLSPTSLTFSSTTVGQVSSAQSVTLTNSGDLALNTISVQMSGPFQATNGCGGSLAAHSSCTIGVVYAPTQTGTQTGTLTVTDTLRSQTVSLSGAGVSAAALSVTPTAVNFATQALNVTSSAQTITVQNTGGSAAANIGFQITGSFSSSFAVSSTTCGTTLASGSSCIAQITFTPQVAGANSANLTVSSSTISVSAVQVPLSGAGQATSGINVSPAQMSFIVATLGQTSAPQIATITNSGSLTASGLTLSVTSPFSLSQNSCGTSLSAGASCTASVVFTPSSNGTVNGTLTVGSATYNSAIVTLAGNGGQTGSITLQPAFLNFQVTGVGKSSASQTMTVTNSSITTVTSVTVKVSTSYQLTSNNCGTSLAPGASCSVGIAFVPAAAGQQNGFVAFSGNELPSPVQAQLSGIGFDFTLAVIGPSSQTVSSGLTAQFNLQLTPLNGSSGTFTFSCGALPSNSSCTFSPTSESVPANTTGSFVVFVKTGEAQAASTNIPGSLNRLPLWPTGLTIAFACLCCPFVRQRRSHSWLLLLVLCIGALGLASCAAAGGGSKGTVGGGPSTPPGTYTFTVTATANGLSHSTNLTLTVD